MKPARYMFLNRGLEMSTGKAAAQSAHAETLAAENYHSEYTEWCCTPPEQINRLKNEWMVRQIDLFEQWFGYGHYAKYVMAANDSLHMFTIERYLEDRKFRTYTVIDEGHTEGTYFVPTAMAVELVDREDERTASIFGEFRLYKEPKRPQPKGTRLQRWLAPEFYTS